jgi:hypothetical protein
MMNLFSLSQLKLDCGLITCQIGEKGTSDVLLFDFSVAWTVKVVKDEEVKCVKD